MLESEFISKVEEEKEYKKEILEEFVFKNHDHLYSKTIGKNLYVGGQTMCVVEKVIKDDYQFLNDNGKIVHIEPVKGIVFAELKSLKYCGR